MLIRYGYEITVICAQPTAMVCLIRNGPSVRASNDRRVADGEDLRMARDGEVRRDLEAPDSIGRRFEPLRGRRRLHAGRPDDGRRGQGLAAVSGRQPERWETGSDNPLYCRTFDLRNAAVAFIGLGGLARRD